VWQYPQERRSRQPRADGPIEHGLLVGRLRRSTNRQSSLFATLKTNNCLEESLALERKAQVAFIRGDRTEATELYVTAAERATDALEHVDSIRETRAYVDGVLRTASLYRRAGDSEYALKLVTEAHKTSGLPPWATYRLKTATENLAQEYLDDPTTFEDPAHFDSFHARHGLTATRRSEMARSVITCFVVMRGFIDRQNPPRGQNETQIRSTYFSKTLLTRGLQALQAALSMYIGTCDQALEEQARACVDAALVLRYVLAQDTEARMVRYLRRTAEQRTSKARLLKIAADGSTGTVQSSLREWAAEVQSYNFKFTSAALELAKLSGPSELAKPIEWPELTALLSLAPHPATAILIVGSDSHQTVAGTEFGLLDDPQETLADDFGILALLLANNVLLHAAMDFFRYVHPSTSLIPLENTHKVLERELGVELTEITRGRSI
jgi:hypothetical protein